MKLLYKSLVEFPDYTKCKRSYSLIFKKLRLLIHFTFGCAGSSSLLRRLFLVATIRASPRCGAPVLGVGFSRCSSQALKHRLRGGGAQPPWHMESSQTSDRTYVPCIGRWILNHWTTRDAPIH